MGYWISMEIDTGGPEMVSVGDLDLNVTWNLTPIFIEALGLEKGIKSMDGELASNCIPYLENGVQRMNEDSNLFESMEPDNG